MDTVFKLRLTFSKMQVKCSVATDQCTLLSTKKQCPSWPTGREVMTTSSCWVRGYNSTPSPTVQSTPVNSLRHIVMLFPFLLLHIFPNSLGQLVLSHWQYVPSILTSGFWLKLNNKLTKPNIPYHFIWLHICSCYKKIIKAL